jgi:peptidoglycan hydrolase-like protein with peptidoglycan-binding domain
MRVPSAVLLAVAVTFSAAIQNEPAAQPGASAKTTAQATKFRRPGMKKAPLRDRAAARRSSQPEARSVEQGSSRATAATTRKLPLPPRARDSLTTAGDRLALQSDLAWTGDYVGLVNGEFNEKTAAAIRAFQRNRKFRETGTLNVQERALLAASAKGKQAQAGWSLIDDPVTGARLGLATKQLPQSIQGRSGTRWSSAQGQVQLETFRISEPGTTLASVHEREKKEPATRTVEHDILRDNYFVLSGTQGLKKFHVRAEFKEGEVRGMTLLYDQATEGIMDPVAVATVSAFVGFPNAAATADTGHGLRRKVEYGTGLIVSAAGHILTGRELTDGCQVIVVRGYGDADRQTEDVTNGLALLRVYGAPDLAPVAFTEGTGGPELTLLGIADPQSQGGGGAISAVSGRLNGDVIEPAPQLGFSGAAVLDPQIGVVGMAELKTPVVAAANTTAQPQAVLVPAASIRAFLASQKLTSVPARTTLDDAKASIVRLICVRK